MILGNLDNCKRYYPLHKGIEEVFEYILKTDFSIFSAGKIELDGSRIFINSDEPILKKKEEQKLEFHHKYIDIQVPLLREEVMGWSDIRHLGEADIAYNEEKDAGFYNCMAEEYITVKPGQFTIFFPEDAHGPIIGEGKQRKLIGKILL